MSTKWTFRQEAWSRLGGDLGDTTLNKLTQRYALIRFEVVVGAPGYSLSVLRGRGSLKRTRGQPRGVDKVIPQTGRSESVRGGDLGDTTLNKLTQRYAHIRCGVVAGARGHSLRDRGSSEWTQG